MDSPENVRRVVDKLGLDFPVLSDPDATAIAAYGVLHPGGVSGVGDIARPAEFLVSQDGMVRWRQVTENWRVRLRPEQIIEAIRADRSP